ncbi:MAG: hypothetical protein IJN27_01545, partial [Oscillospiraceae bacterium]|nr:hypothetical protein [Oscillospiraceae bacterium]
ERQYAFAFKILSLSQLALTAPSSEGAFGLLGLISALQSGHRGRRPLQSIAAILHLQRAPLLTLRVTHSVILRPCTNQPPTFKVPFCTLSQPHFAVLHALYNGK